MCHGVWDLKPSLSVINEKTADYGDCLRCNDNFSGVSVYVFRLFGFIFFGAIASHVLTMWAKSLFVVCLTLLFVKKA